MILERGLRILEAPGVYFINFGIRLGSIFDPGMSLGRHWCIFELLGGSLGGPWSSKGRFSLILGAILEVLGR